MEKENVEASAKAEQTESPFAVAFVVTKDKASGTLGVKAFEDGAQISSQDVYDCCHAICRNIEAQDVATAVSAQMMRAARELSQTENGLVVPNGVKS